FITAGVVATTLVNDARSNIVSSVIVSGAGASARCPYALRQTIVSPRPTTTTAPGSFFAATASRTTSSRRARRERSKPAVGAGAADVRVGVCAEGRRATTDSMHAMVRSAQRQPGRIAVDYTGRVRTFRVPMARPPRSARPQPRSTPPPPPTWSRHAPVAIAIVLLIAGAIAVAWQYLAPARPGAIVLISIDTLRADHLPVYGYTKGQTPVLDAFAKESVVFDRAYSHAPQTLPAHASILTGLLPFEHGVRDNLGFTLAPDKTTIAERFHQAGYKTGGFISAYVLRPETGISKGFDIYNADLPAPPSDLSHSQLQRPRH